MWTEAYNVMSCCEETGLIYYELDQVMGKNSYNVNCQQACAVKVTVVVL